MKILVIAIFACIMGWFHSEPFKIINATEQNWAGGRKESGRGINYIIRLQAKESSEVLKIEKIYLKDMCFTVTAQRQAKDYRMYSDFKKNDTIIIQFSRNWLPINEELVEQKNYTSDKAPIDYKGDALIEYTLKSKKYYQVISTIQKLEPEQYM